MPSLDVRKWIEPGGFGQYESATMRLVRTLVVVLAAALSILFAADPAVAQFTIGGDPRVNPNDFRITTFASGLNYPNGLARLSDGSILVATSNPNGTGTFFASSGALLRFTDTNSDGVADGPGQVMYSDLLGVWVALKVAGPLVFITPDATPIVTVGWKEVQGAWEAFLAARPQKKAA